MPNPWLQSAASAALKLPPMSQLGIALHVCGLWILSSLDASGKLLVLAGVPVLMVAWFRYVGHVLLMAVFVLPRRGRSLLHTQSLPRQLQQRRRRHQRLQRRALSQRSILLELGLFRPVRVRNRGACCPLLLWVLSMGPPIGGSVFFWGSLG